MNKVLLLLFALISMNTFAQEKIESVRAINASMENKSEIFNFLEKSGYLEQYQGPLLFRFKLSEISSIKEKEIEHNFIITLFCRNGGCFNVVKGDSSSTAIDNNSYFFSNEAHAEQFSKNLYTLCQQYQPGQLIELSLLHATPTNTLIATPSAPIAKKEPDGLDHYLEEQDAKEGKKTTSKTNEEDEEENEKVATSKSTHQRKTQDDDNEKEGGGLAKDDDEGEEKGKDDKNSVFCKQINQLIQSALVSQFKNIEGAETNTKTKINESKLKLKGAKRNYLSWYKKQRAFIAEMKTSKDFELLQIQYDELQTQVEKCLGDDWEFSDKSTDDEYADFSGEVRDTEYKLSLGPSPTLHIILISDGDKYTLFIRIK